MNNNRNQQSEEWRRCQYPFVRYEVSNFGRIRHALTKNLLHPAISKGGYLRFTAKVKGKTVTTSVHTQVALAFVDGWREGLQVNHKDGNKLNNCAWNLEWISASENIRHSRYVLGKLVKNNAIVTTQMISDGVYEALQEKGYNPISQLVGYILSEDPTYITTHNNARSLVRRIDRDELLQVLVKEYLGVDK